MLNNIDKLGIFIGTFDPPHKGHLIAANIFKKELCLKKFIVIPSYSPVNKLSTLKTPYKHRFNMAKLCFKFFEVSNIEKFHPNFKTAEIIKYYKEKHNKNLFLCMGSDVFLSLKIWSNLNFVLSNAIISVLIRKTKAQPDLEKLVLNDANYLTEKFGAKIVFIKSETLEISSSYIKQYIYNNKDVRKFLVSDVINYIKKFKLYQKLNQEEF